MKIFTSRQCLDHLVPRGFPEHPERLLGVLDRLEGDERWEVVEAPGRDNWRDAVAAVHDLTGGGADFVFECIGLVATVQQSVAMTGRGGTAVLVGVVPMTEMVPLSAADLTLQEKKVTGSYMGSNRFRFDMPKYIDFYLDGRLRLDEMISSRIQLGEINDAFDRLRKGEVARQVIIFG